MSSSCKQQISGERTGPVRDHTTIRLVNPHNPCCMNSGVLAALHAIRQGGQMCTRAQTAGVHFGQRLTQSGTALGDESTPDAAEFTHHMLHPCEWHQYDAVAGILHYGQSPLWGHYRFSVEQDWLITRLLPLHAKSALSIDVGCMWYGLESLLAKSPSGTSCKRPPWPKL